MRPATLLLALGVLASCGGSGGERHPYQVTIDLAPTIQALGSDDISESGAAVDLLVGLGGRAVAPCAAALEREPESIRAGVVEVLSRLALPEGVPLLVRTAEKDESVDVRSDALAALGTLHDAQGAAVVEAALQSREPSIRLAAAKACARLCTSGPAVKRLVALAITDEPYPNGVAARGGLRAMLRAEDAGFVAAVRGAIEHGARPVVGGSGPLATRARAALLLADTGDATVVPLLLETARSANVVLLRVHAAYALGDVGGADAVAPLVALLESPDAGVVTYGWDSLRRLADRGVRGAAEAMAAFKGPHPTGPIPPPVE